MFPGIETLLGSMLGGVARVATAWLESREKARDRDHEFRMTELQGQQAEKVAEWRMRELGLQADTALGVADAAALVEAVRAQSAEAQSAGGFAASLSATVRPVVTYLLVALYLGHKTVEVAIAAAGGAPMLHAIGDSYGADDMAILASLLSYWFVDRSLRRGALGAAMAR
jgi:hypothetical protein